MQSEDYRTVRSALGEGDLVWLRKVFTDRPDLLREISPLGTWLHLAAGLGKLEVVRELVALGLDLNARGGPGNVTVLRLSASEGFLDIVQWLVRKGAELDVSRPECNPLFGAIVGGHYEIGGFLIDSGIDPRITYINAAGEPMDALRLAKERGACDFVKLLETLSS